MMMQRRGGGTHLKKPAHASKGHVESTGCTGRGRAGGLTGLSVGTCTGIRRDEHDSYESPWIATHARAAVDVLQLIWIGPLFEAQQHSQRALAAMDSHESSCHHSHAVATQPTHDHASQHDPHVH